MTDFNCLRFYAAMVATASATGLLAIGTPAARAATVLAGPTNRQFSVASLPDGNYRFCSDRPPSGSDRVAGVCFRFQKQASQVIGDYYYPSEGSSACLSGRVNGNTISGQAVERLAASSSAAEELSASLKSWRQEGFLKVGNGVYIDDLNRPDAIRYRSALLNLNNFYQYNAGAVSPPTNCPTRPSSFIGVNPNPDNLREIGTSEFYAKPIYLDESSIQQVEGDVYSYTTLIGEPERLSETEYRLDCSDSSTVEILRSRYYDRDGDLQELEIINRAVPIDRANSASEQRYNASRYVCQDYAQVDDQIDIEVIEEVNYQRYRNDIFNYSVLYPMDLLTPQTIDRSDLTSGDGQTFASENNDITLRVFGVNQLPSETLVQRYEQAQTDRSVTYRIIEDDFFVVSGNDDGDVFYRKTLSEEGAFKVLELSYPQTLRAEFDSVARAIADSFATTEVGTGITQLPADVQTAVIDMAATNTEAPSAVFEVVSAEQQTWPDGCLGLPKAGEVCTQALTPGWRVQLEADVPGGMRSFTYRTDETGSQVRFEG